MHSPAFWKNWPAAYKRLFIATASLFIISLAFLWDANFNLPEPVLRPEYVQELEPKEILINEFSLGNTHLIVPGDTYILYEHVFGGPLQPNPVAPSYFLTILVVAVLFILTVLTTLTRFWFFVGMGLFILLVASLRIDSLDLGITYPVASLLILLFYCLPAYSFVFLRPSTPFLRRLVVFGGITAVVAAAIAHFSSHPNPVFYLAANGLVAAVILTIVFVFMVAHEIIASIIFVVTRGTSQKKSLPHFLWITAIYLINLGLLYADKKHIIEWHFFPFSLFLLLTISGILGVWGFRQRESQYESIIKADPFGVCFFLALAAIGFSTVGFLLASANDPGIQFFQDAILYSHIGYGLIFFVYIIVNFISVLGNNLQAYKVIYKPTAMPYFTFRFAGLIATFAFFAYSNWKVSVNQIYASYYNAVGDLHLSRDSSQLAEGYYKRSVFFATRNYHAHYAIAQLLGARNDRSREKQEYINLVDARPLDLAYLNLSQLEVSTHDYDDAQRTLKKGLVDFPNNGRLLNALSLVCSRLGLQDSALQMANAARSRSLSREEAEANITGLAAKFGLNYPADSMMLLLDQTNPGVRSNILALAALQRKAVSVDADPGPDTVLTVYAAAILNNYFINELNPVDTNLIAKAVGLARRPSNAPFRVPLLAASAHASYRIGETATAFKLMHEIAFLGQQHKFYSVIALWALEKGDALSAIQFFDEAVRLNSPSAYFHRAIALTEAGQTQQALEAWDSLSRSNRSDLRETATAQHVMLRSTPQQALGLRDEEKVGFAHFRFSVEEENEFEKITESIKDPELQARAIVDRAERLDEADEAISAAMLLSLLHQLQPHDKILYEKMLHLHLRLLARQNQWSALEKQLHSGITFDGKYAPEKVYIEALLAEQSGNKKEASRLFASVEKSDPFFEDAIIAAVRFRNRNGENQVATYSVLRRALDTNPNSVKLLKAYILQSAYVEFEESAQEALDKLKTLIHPTAFVRFVNENPEIFHVSRD